MDRLHIITLTLPGLEDPAIAIAGSRSGAIGVLDLEYAKGEKSAHEKIKQVASYTTSDFGVKMNASSMHLLENLTADRAPHFTFAILSYSERKSLEEALALLHTRGLTVLLECTSLTEGRIGEELGFDAIIAKGHEAAGRVGNETTFILLQSFLTHLSVPVWAHGGIGLHTAAACYVAGAAGVILDSQLVLTRESSVPEDIKNRIARMDGSETVCLGEDAGECYRVCSRLGMPVIKELEELERALATENHSRREIGSAWRESVRSRVGWNSPDNNLFLLGQDVAFAAPLAEEYITVGGIVQAIFQEVEEHCKTAASCRPLSEGSPLAMSHGTRYPIVQGPMARVSDTAAFAAAVAHEGALPFLAGGRMTNKQLGTLLNETKSLLKDKPWGVGLLGFLPDTIYREQVKAVVENHPPFALLAGGTAQQVKALEKEEIATYVHVPSPGLLRMFLDSGLKRFVFEGRECGGHIGPICSFVLWETMISILLKSRAINGSADEFHVLFAGGIHDSLSAAMVSVMAAPLAKRGIRVGVQLGTAYLFTEEAVEHGAIVRNYQQESIKANNTAALTFSPGHAIRCIDNPFAKAFREKKIELFKQGVPPKDISLQLEFFTAGRAVIACKGLKMTNLAIDVNPENPAYERASRKEQHAEGMYLIGQVAALRDQALPIKSLHHDIAVSGTERLNSWANEGLSVFQRAEQPHPCDVAVIGMACHLPLSPDVQRYWENILNKVRAVREVPRERWDSDLYYDDDRKKKDTCYSKWGAFLDDLPFDPTLFGMPPNSVRAIEPLQLMVLEISRQALADAGYEKRPFPRERTSVILGLSGTGELSQRYGMRTSLPMLFGTSSADIVSHFGDLLPEWTEDTFPGFLLNVAAGRVANRLDLGGLNCSVDAACASSLLAVYLAVKDLEAGTSDMVLVGGADCNQNPFSFMSFSKTQALSPRGECNALDERADGIVLGEGIAVMVLKRLADAERDGDRIYAVIKGFGAGSDGREKSLTAPARDGQVRALQRAYAKAGFSPATVELIEAHATGTAAGDRTEIESLTQVLNEAGVTEPMCAIGSVKCNIGHAKAAAAMASLMKTVLAVYHNVLPPHIGVTNPNPGLRLPSSPLYVNKDARPWVQHAPDHPRRAGVNAFGFGGTNYHAVLEEYTGDSLTHLKPAALQQWPCELLVWKGHSREELLGELGPWKEALSQRADIRLGDLAYSAYQRSLRKNSGEKRLLWTLALVASGINDLKQKLDATFNALANGCDSIFDPHGIYFTRQPLTSEGKIAFLFPGQGSQYVNMFDDLAICFPDVRAVLDRCDCFLAGKLPKPLSTYLYPPSSFTKEEEKFRLRELSQTWIAQPALGAVSFAMLSLLRRLGVKPDMAGGHSYGEFVALCCAGVFSDEDLIAISEARGRFMTEAAGSEPGTMAAVKAGVEAVRRHLKGREGVWIANINAPDQTVITGTWPAIEEMMEVFKEEGIKARPLAVSCAMHSSIVASAAERLSEFLSRIPMNEPVIKVFSNTTGKAYPPDPGAIVSQISKHLVNQVKFVQEIESMYEEGARIFVEVGPGRALSGLVSRVLGDKPHATVFTNQPGQAGLFRLLHALGQLSAQGAGVVLDPLFAGRGLKNADPALLVKESQKVALPATTWLLNGARALPAKEASDSRPAPVVVKPLDFKVDTSACTVSETARVEAPLATRPREKEIQAPALITARGEERAEPAEHSNQASCAEPEYSADASLQGGDDMDQAMIHYQRLMARFLDTQKSIMLAYLQGTTQPGERAARDLSQVISSPARPSAPDLRAVSGQPESHLAASGKRIPRPSAVVEVSPATLRAADMEMPVPALRNDTFSTEQIQARLLAIVSEQTGYPTEMLNLDFDMEAELGIDSIKRVEILGAFVQSFSDGVKLRLEPLLDDLSKLKDLRSVIENSSQALLRGEASARAEVAILSDPKATALFAPAAISDEELQKRLLAIVSEQTGYPTEMLNLDFDMEAELGIDSIKRVEILGAFVQSFSGQDRQRLEPLLDDLSKLKDLRTVLQKSGEALSGKEHAGEEPQRAVPEPVAAAVKPASGNKRSDVVVRSLLTPVPFSLAEADPDGAIQKGTIVITDDGRGIATALEKELKQRGCTVVTLRMGLERGRENGSYTIDLTDFAAVQELVTEIRKTHDRIDGVIHLLPLRQFYLQGVMNLATWRKSLAAEVKSLYYLAKQFGADIRKGAQNGTGWLMAATLQNGHGNGNGGSAEQSCAGHAGIAGFLKTVAQEWPGVRCRSVTVDPSAAPSVVAEQLLREMAAHDDRVVEVVYCGSDRMVFKAKAVELKPNGNHPLEIQRDWVVLVTGGAVGITAEVALELAERYQPTLVLAGRSPYPEAESPETAGLVTPQEIKMALIRKVQTREKNITPAKVEAASNRLLKNRQIISSITRMQEAGASVRYYQADVRDEKGFGQLIDSIYQTFGRLDGVIHGAGVIEDKLLDDKTPDSFDRVFDTKADSAFILANKVRLDDLKFIVFFTSVAGTFGNLGQADYAAANEVVNSLACTLNKRVKGRVVAINWNPWADTGMALQGGLEKMFQERGIQLIPKTAGRRFLDEELRYGSKEEVVIVAGGGPWVE